MEEFVLLKSTLEKQIEDLREKVNEIYEKQEAYKEEKEIVEKLYNKETEEFSNKRRREIIRLYPSMAPLFEVYTKLVNYYNLLDCSKYDQIDSKELSEVLKITCSPLYNIGQYMKDLEYCKKIYPVVLDYSFKDKALKDNVTKVCLSLEDRMNEIIKSSVNAILSTIKKEFNNKFFGLEEEIKSIDDLRKEMELLRRLDIFDKDGNIKEFFESKEKLEIFFTWMIEHVDINTQIKLIPLITKQGLIANAKEKENEVAINRELVLQDLQPESSKEELFDINSIDLSSYTEEEKQIVLQGIDTYLEIRKIEKNRENFLTREDKEDKESFYLLDDVYRWDIVLFDVENNLIPYVSADKENVLNSFKLIIDIYYKYKEELEKRNNILNEIIEEIEQYQELVLFADKYSSSQYDYVIENNIDENSSEYPKGIPMAQISMSYFINHDIKKELEELKKIKAKIEEKIKIKQIMTEENDGVNIGFLDARFDFIYDEGLEKTEEFKEVLKGNYTNKEEEINQSEETENLVFCITNPEETDDREYQEDYKKAYELLAHRQDWTLAKQLHPLWKRSSTGKKESYDIPNVDMKRIRALGDSRIGIARFDVSEEMMKILKDRYKLGDDARVYGVFNAVTPGANHKTYADIHKTVSHNIKYIAMIGQMLNGKNLNIDNLFEIIDSGIERRNALIGENEEVIKHE